MSATVVQPARLRRRARRLLGNGTLIVAVIYVLLFAIFAARESDALIVSSGITDLLNNALPLALAAAGGSLVVLTRGFDLSVAGVVALSNVLMATQVGDGPWGALLGLGDGDGGRAAWSARSTASWSPMCGLQSIASTLATMIICSGLALLILDAPGRQRAGFRRPTG